MDLPEHLVRTLREVVAPLVEADGGVVYLVPDSTQLRLHLAGACAGCPGARTTAYEVIEPALRASGAKLPIVVSAGWIVPEGAVRIQADRSALL